MNWKFWQRKPKLVSQEYKAFLRAEEELEKRQPPTGDCSWGSWETIPGFEAANEEFLKELNERNEKIRVEELALGDTLTATRVRAWYTPSEVVYWGVKRGRIV